MVPGQHRVMKPLPEEANLMTSPHPAIREAVLAAVLIMALPACSNDIWNASDLANWVRDRAVEQGCERDSIELEDWYREEGGKNLWHGSCRKSGSDDRMQFAIDVDPVWKPSAGG